VSRSYHAWKEVLECVKVGEEVDAEVALDVFNGEIEKGFAVDNGGIIDEDSRGSKLGVISRYQSKWMGVLTSL
jgi:hypothetical protein